MRWPSMWISVRCSSRATRLPAHWYSDPDIHALERELVFSRYWQFAGPVEWLDQDGAYFADRAPATSRSWSCATAARSARS